MFTLSRGINTSMVLCREMSVVGAFSKYELLGVYTME